MKTSSKQATSQMNYIARQNVMMIRTTLLVVIVATKFKRQLKMTSKLIMTMKHVIKKMKKMAFLPFILVLIFSAVSILPLILYMYLTFGWPILFYPGISEIFFSFRSKNTRILCTVEGHFVQTSVTFSSVYRYLLVLFVVVDCCCSSCCT